VTCKVYNPSIEDEPAPEDGVAKGILRIFNPLLLLKM